MTTAVVEKKHDEKSSLSTIDDRLSQIDKISSKYCALNLPRSVARANALADAMRQIKNLMNGEILENILYLQGSKLGYLTDKDKSGGYPQDVVRDCVILAMLQGLSIVGNEFNIIAGETYITKAGMTRLVRELPGLTDLKIVDGRPEPANNGQGAFVPMKATWLLYGKPDSLEVAVPVRVNTGMGADAILGKATRKVLGRIHARITGSTQMLDEDKVDQEIDAPS